SPTLFTIAAIFYALCVIPIGLTRMAQPKQVEVPRLQPLKMFRISPVGVAGCIAVGLSNAASWVFLPVYAHDSHMTRALLAGFISAFTLGGALIQMPVGRLSDHMDRRVILAGSAFCATALAVALFFLGGMSSSTAIVLVTIYGMAALPVYGLSVAHAND